MLLFSQLLIVWLSTANAQPSAFYDASSGETVQPELIYGDCIRCHLSEPAKWYFANEIIAELASPPSSAVTLPPWLENQPDIQDSVPVWIASPQFIEQAQLDASGRYITLQSGEELLFDKVEPLPQNRSFWDQSSTRFFHQRAIRLRGETRDDAFIARTVWPLDFAINSYQLLPLTEQEDLQGLVQADDGGAAHPHLSRLLWERKPGAAMEAAGKPVLGIMLNGAQGDDDEALAGHFAVVTGQFQHDGSYHDWLVNNFYNLDVNSEKGITAAVTPMDNYLADLNAGQNYYRPSYLLVAVMRDAQPVSAFQQSINQVMNYFYRDHFVYNHADANCTGISMDTLRALGWNIPERGINGYVEAIGAYFYTLVTEKDLEAARQIYDYLTTETTRLFPAQAFDAIGEDLLQLATTEPARPLTDYEKKLVESLEAIWFVRIPQFPSSRVEGDAPVYSFTEYLDNAPADRSQWQSIELTERQLPKQLIQAEPVNARSFMVPWTIVLIYFGLSSFVVLAIRRIIRRSN